MRKLIAVLTVFLTLAIVVVPFMYEKRTATTEVRGFESSDNVGDTYISEVEYYSIEQIRYYVWNTGLPKTEVPGWDCDEYAISLANKARQDGVPIGLALMIKCDEKGNFLKDEKGDLLAVHLTDFVIVGNRVYQVEPQTGVISNWQQGTVLVCVDGEG